MKPQYGDESVGNQSQTNGCIVFLYRNAIRNLLLKLPVVELGISGNQGWSGEAAASSISPRPYGNTLLRISVVPRCIKPETNQTAMLNPAWPNTWANAAWTEHQGQSLIRADINGARNLIKQRLATITVSTYKLVGC